MEGKGLAKKSVLIFLVGAGLGAALDLGSGFRLASRLQVFVLGFGSRLQIPFDFGSGSGPRLSFWVWSSVQLLEVWVWPSALGLAGY